MFKKVSVKIMARDTTTTTNSNQDVKPLHNLISAEKAVLLSLQKLSVDYAKAAEALRTWGSSEKDDLGGILTASTSLLNHFSLALSQYAAHGHTMQRQLEAISTRGDSLDNLKRRRDDTHRKAEETSNQLSKMNPQHKFFSMHTDALRCLRKDVRKMDSEIKSEDTDFNDFKRTATKVWMTLKFGGLQDCCEKGTIAGRYGKLATAEISEDTTQVGVSRRSYSPNKVDNLLAEADQHVSAVGSSTARPRDSIQNSIQNSQESSHPPSSYISSSHGGHEGPSMSGAPQPPPKPLPNLNNANYHHNGNGHFPDRADPAFPPSSGHRPYAPAHQPQLPQGTVNPHGGYPSQDPSSGGRRPTISESTAGPSHSHGPPPSDRFLTSPGGRRLTMDSTFSESMAHFQGPPSDRSPTSPVQTRPPGSSESVGYAFSQPSIDGRNHNPSFSEGTSHPQDPIKTRPPGSSDPGGYGLQDPRSLGRHPHKADEGTSYWQRPPSDQFPIPARPPGSSGSEKYQDSSSLGGRHPTNNPSFSAGSLYWQSPHPDPPGPSDSKRYQDPPPSSGGRHPTSDPSFSAGSSHWQNAPPPPPGSSGGRYRNGSSPFSEGTSHWQNPLPRPPGESERYPPPNPPNPYSSGGPHRFSDASGSSHSPNSASDRFPIPPPPPPLSEPGRFALQDKSHSEGRYLNDNSSGKRQGPIIMAPSGQTGGYEDPRSSGGHHLNGDSSSMAGTSQWATNQFNGGSQPPVPSEGITRARQGSYSHHPMTSWGDPTCNNPDDSPPAYVDTAGHFSAPPAGSNGSLGRW